MTRANMRQVLGDLEQMKPEKALKIEVDKNLEDAVGKINAHFAKWLEKPDQIHNRTMGRPGPDTVKGADELDVSSKIISAFCYGLGAYEGHPNLCMAGWYLSALANHAIQRGCRSFEFCFPHLETPLYDLCWSIRGEENDRINVLVCGNVTHFARGCRYADIKLIGECSDPCPTSGSSHCNFYFTKSEEEFFARLRETESNKCNIYSVDKKGNERFIVEVNN